MEIRFARRVLTVQSKKKKILSRQLYYLQYIYTSTSIKQRQYYASQPLQAARRMAKKLSASNHRSLRRHKIQSSVVASIVCFLSLSLSLFFYHFFITVIVLLSLFLHSSTISVSCKTRNNIIYRHLIRDVIILLCKTRPLQWSTSSPPRMSYDGGGSKQKRRV